MPYTVHLYFSAAEFLACLKILVSVIPLILCCVKMSTGFQDADFLPFAFPHGRSPSLVSSDMNLQINEEIDILDMNEASLKDFLIRPRMQKFNDRNR